MAQDELGGYYIITVSGKIRGQWGDLEPSGSRRAGISSSRPTARIQRETIVYKPLSQVKEENIIQAAYTNFVANAVSSLRGAVVVPAGRSGEGLRQGRRLGPQLPGDQREGQRRDASRLRRAT
jgi:hypothetical protein